jgi:hypothetical protein
MTNPFKQKQRKQVIAKLTSKHHTTFPPNRIKIGAYFFFFKERLPALVHDLFTFSSKVIKSFIIV